jgi:hypothetical protein
MSDLLDGSGEVVTDGEGLSVWDGDGASEGSDTPTPVTVASSLDPFVTRIRQDIPGVSIPIVEDYVKRVLRDFTGKAPVLYQGIQVQGSGVDESYNKSVAWDMADYIGLEPVFIKDLSDETSSYIAKEKILKTECTDTRYKITGVKFFEIFKSSSDGNKTNIRIFPFDSDPLLYMMVGFKTLPDTTTVPEILVDDWLETICSGVMAQLYMQPTRPWANPEFGIAHKGFYQDGINKAKLAWFRNNAQTTATGRRFV